MFNQAITHRINPQMKDCCYFHGVAHLVALGAADGAAHDVAFARAQSAALHHLHHDINNHCNSHLNRCHHDIPPCHHDIPPCHHNVPPCHHNTSL